MQILYMGTAAYDAIPSPFCTCQTCLRARELGGKDIRSRSQALINGDLLLDFNADTVMHFFKYNVDWNKIDNCLITHSHSDHFNPDDMIISRHSATFHKINYFVGQDGYNKLHAAVKDYPIMLNEQRISINLVEPYKEFTAGGYRILPIEARHDMRSSPVFYAIERDGKRLLYCHDTGILPEDAYPALKTFGTFHLVSIDCTGGLAATQGAGHLCLSMVVDTIKKFRNQGIVDQNTQVVINHFSHNGQASHEQLVAAASPHGFITAYDGLTLTF